MEKVFYEVPMPHEFDGDLWAVSVGMRGAFSADVIYYVSGSSKDDAIRNLRKVIGFDYQQIKRCERITF